MLIPVVGLWNMRVAGKGLGFSQPLPVVAMGLIPHIYRRTAFPYRATPWRLPFSRSNAGAYVISGACVAASIGMSTCSTTFLNNPAACPLMGGPAIMAWTVGLTVIMRTTANGLLFSVFSFISSETKLLRVCCNPWVERLRQPLRSSAFVSFSQCTYTKRFLR